MRCESTGHTATVWRVACSATRSSTSPHYSRRCSLIITWRSSLAAMLGALLLAACDAGGPKFKSTDITGVDYGKQLSLTDQNGRPRSLQDFRGKVVALFFGYTHCPDVCPTTLADMAQVMGLLGQDADKLQVLFVTLDPARDTQGMLRGYMPAFHPAFMGLAGDAAATEQAVKAFGIAYQKNPQKNGG